MVPCWYISQQIFRFLLTVAHDLLEFENFALFDHFSFISLDGFLLADSCTNDDMIMVNYIYTIDDQCFLTFILFLMAH